MIDAYHELIDELSGTPARLQAIPIEAANAVPRSNEVWGVPEIIAHMVDIERVYRGRIMEVLSQDSAYLKAVDPDALAREHDYASSDMAASVVEFGQERGETLSLLFNLALKDWEKTGIHYKHGEVSVEDLIERLINHDRGHLEQIETVLAGATAQ
jgi:hypothetical protein